MARAPPESQKPLSTGVSGELRGRDLNPRPPGYEGGVQIQLACLADGLQTACHQQKRALCPAVARPSNPLPEPPTTPTSNPAHTPDRTPDPLPARQTTRREETGDRGMSLGRTAQNARRAHRRGPDQRAGAPRALADIPAWSATCGRRSPPLVLLDGPRCAAGDQRLGVGRPSRSACRAGPAHVVAAALTPISWRSPLTSRGRTIQASPLTVTVWMSRRTAQHRKPKADVPLSGTDQGATACSVSILATRIEGPTGAVASVAVLPGQSWRLRLLVAQEHMARTAAGVGGGQEVHAGRSTLQALSKEADQAACHRREVGGRAVEGWY